MAFRRELQHRPRIGQAHPLKPLPDGLKAFNQGRDPGRLGKARWMERQTAEGMIRDLLRSLEDRSCKSLIEDRTEPGGQRLHKIKSRSSVRGPQRSWRTRPKASSVANSRASRSLSSPRRASIAS